MRWLPQQAIAALDLGLRIAGETVVLQRLATDDAGAQYVANEATCRAGVRASRPQSLAGSDGAPDSDLILSPTDLAREGWPGIPVTDDRVLVQGRENNLQTVSPIYIDGVLVRIDCQFAE